MWRDNIRNSPDDTQAARVSLSRYDLVLAVIPSAFVVALLLAHILSIPPRMGFVGASLIGALVLFDALFLNPPRGPRSNVGLPD